MRIHWEYEPSNELYLVLNQGIDRNEGRLRWTESELAFKIGLSLRFCEEATETSGTDPRSIGYSAVDDEPSS